MSKKSPKSINLALQGGGSHGAFTWGVLDRLLDDDRLQIEAVSGTSAGAMNATVMADGYRRDGARGAQEALNNFWKEISIASRAGPIQRNPFDMFLQNWNADNTPGYILFDLMTRLFSPYELNPFNYNPLHHILEKVVDFNALRKKSPIKLFISATNINRGVIKIFKNTELTPEALLASACVPYLFQAVEVDGDHFWDGGYMGNPALFPLIYDCSSRDVVIVRINPLNHEGVPKTSIEILDRLNEINFNASLVSEIRAIDFVKRMLSQDRLDKKQYKNMLIHMVEAEELMSDLGVASKLNAEWSFLTYLRDIGRDAAESWLKKNYDKIGTKDSVNLAEAFHLKAANT